MLLGILSDAQSQRARIVPVLGRADRSRRALIEVEQPAKPPAAPHAARPVGHRRVRDESIVETLMIPLAMIVLDELSDYASRPICYEAICSYILQMASTGIRQLKDNLSRYIRRIEAGERIAITAHGRVVAELVPPGTAGRSRGPSRFDELVAAGVIRPPLESGDPTEDWPDIRLPRGTAAELIDADRGEE